MSNYLTQEEKLLIEFALKERLSEPLIKLKEKYLIPGCNCNAYTHVKTWYDKQLWKEQKERNGTEL